MWHQLLREDSIFLHLEAPSAEAALTEMIAMFRAPGFNAQQKSRLLEFLLQRERFGTTALGDGIALPHCVFPEIESSFGCLGISRKGIPFPSLDGEPVYLLYMAVFPESGSAHAERFLLLREAEMFFKDAFVRHRLRTSEAPEEAYEIIARESLNFSPPFRMAGNQ